jgi:hypothetical protein
MGVEDARVVSLGVDGDEIASYCIDGNEFAVERGQTVKRVNAVRPESMSVGVMSHRKARSHERQTGK